MSTPANKQVVVVTGASGGIGRATAQAFGARGATVALLARGQEGLAGAARDVQAAGGTALPIPTDVADPEQVEAAAERVEAELGPIDVWVNVAFTSVFARFVDIEPEEYKRVTEVNYLGFVYATMAALKRMTPRDAGTIVQVGSALAYRGIPRQTAYCGSKHALQGFHEALRCELLHEKSNVHVTMVQMPAVNTPQFSWVLNRLPTRSRSRRSTSPRSPPAGCCTPPTTRSAGSTGWAPPRWALWPPTPSRRACWIATWPAPGFPPSRPTRRAHPTSPSIFGSQRMAPTDATTGRTESSTTRPSPVVPSCGRRITTVCSARLRGC